METKTKKLNQLKVETRKLSELKEFEENIRIHPEKQIKELIRSINQFGQTRPILIDENNTIFAGNGLYRALKEMGIEEVSVSELKGYTNKEKIKLMMADNKIYELGLMDNDAFLEAIKKVKDGDEFDVPGMDEEILKNLFASTEEIDTKIESYGVITDEDTENLNKVKDTSEKKDFTVKEEEIEITNDKISIDKKRRPFIKCPKCNEHIWL